MEEKDAVAAEKSAPEAVEAAGQLSEDELNNVAGGVSVHPDTFGHTNTFVNKLP